MSTDLQELRALCELIADPDDHEPLHPAPAALVDKLGALQRQRALRERSGALVDEPFDALLVRERGDRAFPVRDGVADLLPGSAIVLQPGEADA